MLKDTDRYERNDSAHFTYSDYKNKVKKNTANKDVVIFVSVFVFGLLVILAFAKILSPNVDVAIPFEEEQQYEELADNGSIDSRLRTLQMEDDGKKNQDEEMFSPELDEKVVIPKQIKKTVGEIKAEMQENQKKVAPAEPAPKTTVETEVKKPEVEQQKPAITNARVVVGSYATEKQAEVAKSIIQDSEIGISPIVKHMDGYYTLQVGVYSTKEKAQQAANNLLKSNFPARVVVD